MADEPKLPWPDYRMRDGWRMLAVGETKIAGDVLLNDTQGDRPCEWIKTSDVNNTVAAGIEYFRRTRPDATLPPVEPIPVEPAEAAESLLDKAANEVRVLIGARIGGAWRRVESLEEERDDLRKQVEALTKERDESVAALRIASTSVTNAAPARDWLAELRPCRVRHHAEDAWKQAWFHDWYDAPEGRWAWAEMSDGTAGPFACITFTDPTKEPQS